MSKKSGKHHFVDDGEEQCLTCGMNPEHKNHFEDAAPTGTPPHFLPELTGILLRPAHGLRELPNQPLPRFLSSRTFNNPQSKSYPSLALSLSLAPPTLLRSRLPPLDDPTHKATTRPTTMRRRTGARGRSRSADRRPSATRGVAAARTVWTVRFARSRVGPTRPWR